MRINEKKQRIKTLRKLVNRASDLGWGGLRFDWVPVEEPQFIGWETTLTLSEAALRRSDGYVLLEVLNILKLTKPRFTRKLDIVKLIRRNNKTYSKISVAWTEHQRRIIKDRYWNSSRMPYDIVDIYEHFITADSFAKLNERQRKYFDEVRVYSPATWCSEAKTYFKYRLGGRFPKHELRVKLDKAYSTHRGIPRGDEMSEGKYLDTYLHNEHYWCAKNGTQGRRRSKSAYDKLDNRKYRRKVNTLAHVVKIVMNSEDPEEMIEKYEGKINLKRDRSWW